MSRYLKDKFMGKYRILAEYDQSTNDYIRDEKLNLDPSFGDLYIPCKNGGRVNHLERNNLQFYIPNLRKGRNIITKIAEAGMSDLIHDVVETDSEITFIFKSEYLNKLDKVLKPRTSGAGISPFSVKNLPKDHYKIPSNDKEKYTKMIEDYTDSFSKLGKISREFVRKNNLKSDVRIGSKELIHKSGKWDEYLEFLKERIEDD